MDGRDKAQRMAVKDVHVDEHKILAIVEQAFWQGLAKEMEIVVTLRSNRLGAVLSIH